MKKLSLYASLLVSLFAVSSCNEDYNADVVEPQTNEQEEVVKIPTITLTPSADIDLETNTEEILQFVTYQIDQMPEGAEIAEVIIKVAADKDSAAREIEHDNGAVLAANLQKIVADIYGKASEQRSLCVTASSNIIIDGQAAPVVSEPVTVKVTPMIPVVVPEFYLVGGLQGWDNTSRAAAFYPIDAKAATLSYTTNFSLKLDGTPTGSNFKIFSADQIGSWDNCYGAEVDGDTSLTGRIVSYNPGAILCPTEEIYTLNVDMINNTYEMVLAADQAPTEYTTIGLIGEFNTWSEQEAMTQVTPHNWYLEGFVLAEAGELKFRADDDWDISWGHKFSINDVNYGVLDAGGENITVPAGTYNVYFNDITRQTLFITVE